MVFLLGFGSCLLHVQVKERKMWSPELESLRGDVYMDSWPARCSDRIDKSLVYLVVLSRVRLVRLFYFELWMLTLRFTFWLLELNVY